VRGVAIEIAIDTPRGPARVHFRRAAAERAAIVLGHGAGGGIAAPDLRAAGDAAIERGVSVALVEQPYRVAGRRAPAPARQLDDNWRIVIAHLCSHELAGGPLIVGGRSLGARVACRTSADTGAVGVLCLAFPLMPPARRSGKPAQSRLGELDALAVPALVVQGRRDPFGIPPARDDRRVVQLQGDHSLRADPDGVRAAVGGWLSELLGLTASAGED
jgi:predicted alpha/beta-hydrolase family hydrolase